MTTNSHPTNCTSQPTARPTPALDSIVTRLRSLSATRTDPATYRVPGLWLDPYGPTSNQVVVPERFFLNRLSTILSEPAQPLVTNDDAPGEWSRYAVAYNLFVRAGAAWDHAGDGQIRLEPDASGWRETGTFLKAITLLPFIRSLGCNTVHLLPVMSIGRDGHKGTLGSPFAIRDPYALEPTLAEPALGLGANLEFAAFVEAAHHLGLRVVVEFVFRTVAKDSTWAGEHPEWFYWIRASVPDREANAITEDAYGAPLFTPAELERIYDQVEREDYTDLPAPHAAYRRMFTPPPRPEGMRLVKGRWLGTLANPRAGHTAKVRIPGAFSDWTPDSDQPPWTDITYLRLYDHPDFNYIAYNTVRMYDARLARPEYAVMALWDKLTEVIPHYQRSFGIDGVMIDMGHALPVQLKRRMVARARTENPDFALWAEDFQLKPNSRDEGYNVVVGPFMQTVRNREQLLAWLHQLATTGVPVPFMATPENHNCPRAVTWPGGLAYSIYAMTIGACLPAVPYIHGGSELAETGPINTGFDFTPKELAALPATALPLFSAAAYDWTRLPNIVPALRRILEIRARYVTLITDPSPESIRLMDAGNPLVVAFQRGRLGLPGLGIVANSDMAQPQTAQIPLTPGSSEIKDLLSNTAYPVAKDGTLKVSLAPGQVIVMRCSAR